MEIKKPYLLFLGDAHDQLAAKVAEGIKQWHPEYCVGQFRMENCHADCHLVDMDIAVAKAAGAKTLVVGVANRGGIISSQWISVLSAALQSGMDLAAGLHNKLADVPELNALAIEREILARGGKATFRATGQTGILISGAGVSIDAVVSDFVSGAVETLTPDNEADHWDVIEGQGSLFHPSFAGVTTGLIHGAQPDALVLCHEPTRRTMRGVDYPIPELGDCMALSLKTAQLTNPKARFVGISVNTAALSEDAAFTLMKQLAKQYDLPVIDPFRQGVGAIVDQLADE
ncbi:DUF1611 domain-containing protein [uncultured Klebsiella sp.]|uniref:DUF1611 domain-containing protein n=1 Tax=uncultured Klebsiella sp. TaxID=284011 RepID=UPI00280380BF|nr:DUF1611 domain-containing protein [uncultured Klebsiella sp.]